MMTCCAWRRVDVKKDWFNLTFGEPVSALFFANKLKAIDLEGEGHGRAFSTHQEGG